MAQRLQRMTSQRNAPLTPTLAANDDFFAGVVEVATVDGNNLRNSDTSGIQSFQNRAVARSQNVGVIGRRKQSLNLLHRDGLRKALGLLGRTNQDHRIGWSKTLAFHPLMETAQRGNLASHGGRGILLLAKLGEELADQLHFALQHTTSNRVR